jgi:uncharacterized protein YndB with AHSA1/START domain
MALARSKPAERTLTLERVFDAPIDLVWRCWTEKEHLEKWSRPRGFTIPQSSGDLRPGGRWHVTMRTPDGHDRGLGGEYREIVPMRRLVMTHVWDDEGGRGGPQTLVTVSFEDLGGRTRVTLVQSGFDSEESRKGHEGGWRECLDILAEHLAALRSEFSGSA